MTELDGPAVWRAIDDRRIYLDLQVQELADKAGVSANTLRNVGRGKPTRALNTARIEQALRWKPGSLDRVRRGEPPLVVGGENPPFKLRSDREWDIWAEEDLSVAARIGAIRQSRDTSIRQTG